jgi:hypothetical protein
MNQCAFAGRWNRMVPAVVHAGRADIADTSRPTVPRVHRARLRPAHPRRALRRRLHPDIHIDAAAELDLQTWSRAAHELVAPCGVLAGHSAALLHGASCEPENAPAEVILLGGYRRRAAPMLAVHLDAISSDEIVVEDGLRLTTPDRAAADVARWAPSLTEAVVAVDALSGKRGIDPAAILDHVPPGARGAARTPPSTTRGPSPPACGTNCAHGSSGCDQHALVHSRS